MTLSLQWFLSVARDPDAVEVWNWHHSQTGPHTLSATNAQMRFYLSKKVIFLWLLFWRPITRLCILGCLPVYLSDNWSSLVLFCWSIRQPEHRIICCFQMLTIWSALTIVARLSRCSSFSVFLWIAFSNNEYLVSLCMGWTTMSMRRSLLQSFWVSHHWKSLVHIYHIVPNNEL